MKKKTATSFAQQTKTTGTDVQSMNIDDITLQDIQDTIVNTKNATTSPVHFPCNIRYEGELLDGKLHGNGMIYVGDVLVYKGQFANNELHGEGVFYKRDGIVCYEGQFRNGKKHGKGKTYYGGFGRKKRNTVLYEGDFADDCPDGFGTFYTPDGKVCYKGYWKNGTFSGQGAFYFGDVLIEEGNFENGKLHGFGKKYDEDGTLQYEGEFKEGEFDGIGALYFANGVVYAGRFANGEITGDGEWLRKDGKPFDPKKERTALGGYYQGKMIRT